MTFSLKSFREKLLSPSTPSRFYVKLNIPTLMEGKLNTNTFVNEMSLLCSEASLPSTSLATSEERTYGPIQKYPYSTIYTDLELSFICRDDTQMSERTFFYKWMELINPTATFKFSYHDKYVADIEVIKLDRQNLPVQHIRFMDAYPILLGEQKLSWDSSNQILSQPVTFAFRKWIDLPPDRSGGELISTSEKL